MNGVLGAAAIVTALVGVVALLYTTRDRVRARKQQQAAETAALAGQKFAEGATQERVAAQAREALLRTQMEQDRADAAQREALLRSQRDDARRDRDDAARRADEFERRYNDIRDRRNGGT